VKGKNAKDAQEKYTKPTKFFYPLVFINSLCFTGRR